MKNQINTEWQRLSPQERLRFLAALAHQLTVSARSAYLEAGCPPAEALPRLKAFNEMQHQATAQVLAAVEGTECYPFDVFVNIVFETASPAGSEEGLEWAFRTALDAATKHSSRDPLPG